MPISVAARNASYQFVKEDNPCAIIAFGNECSDDFEITLQHHARVQFLHSGSSIMTVRTEQSDRVGNNAVTARKVQTAPAYAIGDGRIIALIESR